MRGGEVRYLAASASFTAWLATTQGAAHSTPVLDDVGFSEPRWTDPIDADAAIVACPSSAQLNGIMSTALVDAARTVSKTLPSALPRYLPFQPYPLREHMRLLVEAAAALYPNDPMRIAFRRFGRGVRSVVSTTPYGRVAFGRELDARDTVAALTRCYRVMLDCSVEGVLRDPRCANIEMRDIHYFMDSLHVGTVEGIFIGSQIKPRVLVKMHDASNATFRVRW